MSDPTHDSAGMILDFSTSPEVYHPAREWETNFVHKPEAINASPKKRNFCGVTSIKVAVLIALIALTVAVAFIAVAGVMVSERNKANTRQSITITELAEAKSMVSKLTQAQNGTNTCNSTPSATSTSSTSATTSSRPSAPVPTGTSALASGSGCTDDVANTDGTNFTTFTEQRTFVIHCNTNVPFLDVMGTMAPSLRACIENCAVWNKWLPPGADECKGVVLVPQYYSAEAEVRNGLAASDVNSNCYLKSDVSEGKRNKTSTNFAHLAVLL